jgi:hypothetical protein
MRLIGGIANLTNGAGGGRAAVAFSIPTRTPCPAPIPSQMAKTWPKTNIANRIKQ